MSEKKPVPFEKKQVVDEQKKSDDNLTAQAATATAMDNPIFQQCLKLGEELAQYGVAWGFGASVNTGEMRPAMFAEAAGQILIQKGICTPDEWDNMVYTVLLQTMQKILAAVKQQRRSGLVMPNGTPVPPDLLPKKVD